MTSPLRRKRQTTQLNTQAAKPYKVSRRVLFALTVIFSCLPATDLLADDPPAARLTLAVGDQPAASPGSSLRLLTREPGSLPAPAPVVRSESVSSTASAGTPVTERAAPKQLFSRAKWEGPAAISREPDLHWKGAFHCERQPSAVADPGVVQTSGELPLDALEPVMLPTPSGTGLSDSPSVPQSAQPQAAEPPLPIRIAPSTEPSAAPLPTLEQQLAAQPALAEKCISPRDLKSIGQITADISVKPEDLTGKKRLPPECSLGDTPLEPRHWRRTTFAWTAASTCHNPLYFEEEQLERYGHSWGPVKQTAISAVQFFATAPLLPYYMGVYPPNECIYDLGQYRPGSCAPYYLDPFPLSVRGALFEGTFLGLIPVAL